MMNKTRFLSVTDKLIFGFVILFLISLQNSIFVNQLGYYGALILILIQYFAAGKNKFRKTGFEWIFLLFLLAEVLSTIFSANHPLAFQNLLKRILLIPIVYVMLAAADNLEKAKLFFKVYIGAALVTILFYIAFAYEHFIHQLYQLETKGPSPFQYVMTAGGLISIVVVFLFAFLLNEKMKIKYKLLILAGFLISSLALFASYTRAAWIGTAAGIFLTLIIKRKWFVVIPVVILAIVFIVIEKNTTQLKVYNTENNSIRLQTQLKFDGRIYSVYSEDKNLFAAAYQKGVVDIKNASLIPELKTPAPVSYFSRWKDNYYFAFLIDSRIEVFEKQPDGKFLYRNELLSPGISSAYQAANNYLYVTDQDSGLTIFTNPLQNKYDRYTKVKKIRRLFVNSEYISLFTDDNILAVFRLENGLPVKEIFEDTVKTKFGFMTIQNGYLLFTKENSSLLFKLQPDKVVPVEDNHFLKKIQLFTQSDHNIYAADFSGNIYELNYIQNGKLGIKRAIRLNSTPQFIHYQDGNLYILQLKLSRVNSIFDPYYLTNMERMHQWRAGWEILKDHPLFGVGDIDMHPVYKIYMNYFEKETYGHLHNNYVQLLAALGLFGFIIVIILLIKILLTHIKIYRTVKNEKFVSSYSLGALAVFVAFLVSGLAEWNFGDHEIITMIWFTLGLNLAFYRNFLSENKETINPNKHKAVNSIE